MIVRPQQHWLRRIFVWHGSVLSKISSRLLLNFLFSIAVIFMLPWYTHLGIKFTLAPFSILGVAIAIFLGFRNNAGYARYVEARKLWGQLMIASRSLLREVKTTLPDSASVREFARLQIAFAHCLRMTLRKQPQAEVLAHYLKTEDLQRVLASNSPANRIWYQNDANKTGAYVDSWALYNWFDNSVSSDNRSADDYDSRGVTASVEGGYTFEAGTFSGSEGTLNTWYVQPQAQITWMGVKDSDHTRKDGTRIETEGDGNVQTRLGVKTYLNSHHQRDDGKQREFQPYIEANWINNSKVYAVKMNGQTVGREGARNLGEVRTGVEAKVNNNLSLWGNVGVQLGDKGYSDTQGMLGVKYSW